MYNVKLYKKCKKSRNCKLHKYEIFHGRNRNELHCGCLGLLLQRNAAILNANTVSCRHNQREDCSFKYFSQHGNDQKHCEQNILLL